MFFCYHVFIIASHRNISAEASRSRPFTLEFKVGLEPIVSEVQLRNTIEKYGSNLL